MITLHFRFRNLYSWNFQFRLALVCRNPWSGNRETSGTAFTQEKSYFWAPENNVQSSLLKSTNHDRYFLGEKTRLETTMHHGIRESPWYAFIFKTVELRKVRSREETHQEMSSSNDSFFSSWGTVIAFTWKLIWTEYSKFICKRWFPVIRRTKIWRLWRVLWSAFGKQIRMSYLSFGAARAGTD